MLMATVFAMALFGHRPAPVPQTHHYRTGEWTLTVTKDRFDGKTLCSLSGRNLSIHRDTAIFRLGAGVDTDAAEFRVDGGPAHSVLERTAANAAHGVFPERGWVENPSGGEVALPLADVQTAKVVYIRAGLKGKIHRFGVARLDYILRSAAGLGCSATAL